MLPMFITIALSIFTRNTLCTLCVFKELNTFTVMSLYWSYHKIMIIKQKTKND